jgi:hypothetical protein
MSLTNIYSVGGLSKAFKGTHSRLVYSSPNLNPLRPVTQRPKLISKSGSFSAGGFDLTNPKSEVALHCCNLFVAPPVLDLQAAADRLSAEIIRNRLEYWTLILGPKFSHRERRAMNLSRSYFLTQVEYCRNFIFKRNFPIRKTFERSCEIGLWRMTARKISEVFGQRLTKRLRGKLYSTLERIDHGHHIFRAYFKNSFIKQYEKFSTFLRNELCSNNLRDLGLKKGLENLNAVRQLFQDVTNRFADFQAKWLNVHADFSLLERLAHPIQKGATRIAGIKIHDTRMIRLMEVLLDAGTTINAWSARNIHQILLGRFRS